MWIIAIIVLLLIWGNLSRKSAGHPLNSVTINRVYPLNSTESTAGDNFNSGAAFAAGVPEKTAPPVGAILSLPVHAAFPVAPPPLKITAPQPPLRTVPVALHPITPIISRPVQEVGPLAAPKPGNLPTSPTFTGWIGPDQFFHGSTVVPQGGTIYNNPAYRER